MSTLQHRPTIKKMTRYLFILPLWVLLVAHPQAATDDMRTSVALNDTQKSYVLDHMKTMLETIALIQSNLADGKPEQVAHHVQTLQTAARKNHPKGLKSALPEGFRALSKTMNSHWKVLATTTKDASTVNGELAVILNQCNACHRSYSLR